MTKRKLAISQQLSATEQLSESTSEVRLDSWLHAARFFKTRALAAAAVEAGRVELNEQRTKRAKSLHADDRLRIRLGPVEYRITVQALSKRRGSPKEAALLYQEDPESRAARERAAEMHRLARQLGSVQPKGRPTKRDRRELGRLKGRD